MYTFQAHWISGTVDYDVDSLKKSFSIFGLLPPSMNSANEYTVYSIPSKN